MVTTQYTHLLLAEPFLLTLLALLIALSTTLLSLAVHRVLLLQVAVEQEVIEIVLMVKQQAVVDQVRQD